MVPKADLIIRCMVTKRVSVERAEIRGSGTSGDSDAAQRSAAPGLIGTSGDSDAAQRSEAPGLGTSRDSDTALGLQLLDEHRGDG